MNPLQPNDRSESSPSLEPLRPLRADASALDLAAIRARLAGARGPQFWRSLEELAQTPEFVAMMQREFPAGASEWAEGLSRRNFLKLAAASLALAGLTACTKQPTHQIYPYVKQPSEMVLGEPLYYATSMLLDGFATGVLAKSREGHPIKVDGSPRHPASLGGSNVWLQAAIFELYDPDRSQAVTRQGDISTWALFMDDLANLINELESRRGAGVRFLTETITSPTLAAQLSDLLQRYPQARWYQYDSVSRDSVRQGARLAFGEPVEPHYRLDQATVILSLDSDFLQVHPDRLRNARLFTNGRRLSAGADRMNRLYVVESSPTITGSMADHRLPLASGEVEAFARELVRKIHGEGNQEAQNTADNGAQRTARPTSENAEWLDVLAKDLQANRGTSLVIAGEWQPPQVHALAHLLNQLLGSADRTVFYTSPVESLPPGPSGTLGDLAAEMKAGAVETLFILGLNPAYSAPADLEFAATLAQVKRSIHLGLYLDETATLCTWHIPQAHFLESWGDARAFDGTISFLQPLIAPLYNGRTVYELLGALTRQQPLRSDYEIVRDYWQNQPLWADFDAGWRQALHDGLIADTAAAAKSVHVSANWDWSQPTVLARPVTLTSPAPPAAAAPAPNPFASPDKSAPMNRSAQAQAHEPTITGLELCFRPDPSLWDGRFANNGWLQECPRPITKLTWDNAALISPALAQRAGLNTGDIVELSLDGRMLEAPVWILPGQAKNSVTLPLGYGRSRAGRVGDGVGFNAGQLRTTQNFWAAAGAGLRPTGRRHLLVATQTHHQIGSPERQVYRAGTLGQYLAKPDFLKSSVESPRNDETLYNPGEFPYNGYKWAMSIDLSTCIGCNACLVACEAENNIPAVGKDQVSRNREMFWIRIDTYYQGDLDNPRFHHMPVPCMHCEHAPCELVCPVAATVHDHEGLNLQVYNRCVGTRFCSNNCPYKVRRFNFLRYTNYQQPSWKPMYNPEVTVRWRGVMEKCSYCIQRISAARITAEKENRAIREGEIQTACQQACPAQAIVFGDLNASESRVAALKRHPLDYPMLGELNTRPRTTYLAKVQNPNDALASHAT